MNIEVIDSFRNEYFFLSNFSPCRIRYKDDLYLTVEHAFQAAKSLNKKERLKIRNAKTPNEAKGLGRAVKLRPGWDGIRIPIMRRLLLKKFKDSKLKRLLLNTEDIILIEGNYHHDYFWGVCNNRGKNNHGKLLMEIRTIYQMEMEDSNG